MRWLVLALFGGCYSPSIAPCHLACAADTSCPDNLVCNGQSMCAVTASSVCTDASVDDGDIDAQNCGLPKVSNINACALDVMTTNRDIRINGSAGRASINTETLEFVAIPNLVLIAVNQTNSLDRAVVAVVKSLTIDAGGALDITGASPLIILSREAVSIAGPITLASSIDDPTCATHGMTGGWSANMGGGGGGGGGSFGAIQTGAMGGVGGTDIGPDEVGGDGGAGGQVAAPGEALVPLRAGCPGGKGGSAGVIPFVVLGGDGGTGGGALQIASFASISVNGAIISANGGGGVMGSSGVGEARAGGGGGGAGGAILLEAPTVTLQTAQLCANGGGGGGSTGPGSASNGCDRGTGGTGIGNDDGLGGDGATKTMTAVIGLNGLGIAGDFGHGAGGGGGGVGRIRINGMIAGSTSTSSPAPSTGPLP